MGSLGPIRLAEAAILVALVAVTVYADWRWRRIPNAATFPAMAAGLVLGALEGLPGSVGGGGLLDHAAGIALAFVIAWPLYAGGGIKAGDGKLLMAIGALGGFQFFIYAFFYGAILGGVIALVLIVSRRLDPADPESSGWFSRFGWLGRRQMPYGIALAIGALLALARDLFDAGA